MTHPCDPTPPLDDHGAACPFSGAHAASGGGVSRRRLLRLGIGALATSPALARLGADSATAKPTATPTPTPTPIATPAAGAAPTIPGAPKWRHAVGDPRGTDVAVALGRAKEGRY